MRMKAPQLLRETVRFWLQINSIANDQKNDDALGLDVQCFPNIFGDDDLVFAAYLSVYYIHGEPRLVIC